MKGIIIAGGLGTRLRPLTNRRPKPLVPVAGRPFLEYQVALLRAHNITDIVFATNYMADQIEAHFGDGSRFGVRMRCAREETPLGTGGAIRNAADLFPGEAVAVFNGDILTDFDLSAIIDSHRANRALATITLFDVRRPHPFGIVAHEPDGRVTAWLEPTEEAKRAVEAGSIGGAGASDGINAGFYLLEREVIDRIPAGERRSVEREIFPALIAESSRVYSVTPDGFWMDVGRSEQLLTASRAILGGAIATRVDPIPIGPGCELDTTCTVDRLSAIGPECRVGAGADVRESILMHRVIVEKSARVQGVILDDAVVIGEGAEITCAPGKPPPVLAAGSRVGPGSVLRLG